MKRCNRSPLRASHLHTQMATSKPCFALSHIEPQDPAWPEVEDRRTWMRRPPSLSFRPTTSTWLPPMCSLKACAAVRVTLTSYFIPATDCHGVSQEDNGSPTSLPKVESPVCQGSFRFAGSTWGRGACIAEGWCGTLPSMTKDCCDVVRVSLAGGSCPFSR